MAKLACYFIVFIVAGMMCLEGFYGNLGTVKGIVGWFVVIFLSVIEIIKILCDIDDKN